MSREDQNSKFIKYSISSNESINKKDLAPPKNSQNINTETYEYYNQKTTSEKNITESPFSHLNQNSRYSSNNHNSNSKFISKNVIIPGNAQSCQGNTNLYGLQYSNENIQKSDLEYSSSPQVEENLICDQCKKQLFEQRNSLNQSGKGNYGYQSINQQKKISSSTITFNNNNSNKKSFRNSNNFQKETEASGDLAKSQTLFSKTKVITYVSPNNPSLEISEEKSKTFSSGKKGRRIETNSNYCTCSGDLNTNRNTNRYNKETKESIYTFSKDNNININNEDICTCSNNINLNNEEACTCSNNNNINNSNDDNAIDNYSYYDSSGRYIGNTNNSSYNYSRRINRQVINVNNINRSHSLDSINRRRIIKKVNVNIIHTHKCVGQNNESLQILATQRPELVSQCVQDLQVIQEPRPIQILLPIQPNEIDYTLGLEICGKNKEEEKRALKEAEKLRKQMEITPESIEEMFFNKAYDKIAPQFDNLYIDKNYDIFCEKQILGEEDRKSTRLKRQKKPLSVQHSHIKVSYKGLNKSKQPFTIESEEMNVCGEKTFAKNNKKVLTTKMLVKGIYKPDWNDLNEAIKTTKMNIDAVEKEPEEEEEESIKKPEPIKAKAKVKKQVKKKPVKKKPVKKIIKKKELEKETDEELTESETPQLDIENFDLNIEESGRQFGPLKIRKMTHNYRGVKRPKGKEKQDKKKYNKNEMIFDSNDALEYDADFKKNLSWCENSFPMTGRPFTIEGREKPILYTNNVEKLSLKPAYKPKDWNKSIKERNVIKINMPTRKKRLTISKQRIQPIILRGTPKSNWNNVIKKQSDSKLEIDKTKGIRKGNFVFSKGNEVYIENETDEILVNDDYNIVEENYTRPVRAYIRKVEDATEESVTSDYDILNNIHKHDDQFNQFRELVKESVKMNGQKVIINDISGKYPRRVEIFEGLDEHFQKLANDQKYHKRFNQVIKTNMTKEVNRTVERNIEQSVYTQKFGGKSGGGYFTSKKIIQKRQINDDEPAPERVYYVNSKFSTSGGKQRKIGDFDNNLQSRVREIKNKEFNDFDNMNMRQAYYFKGVTSTSSGRKLNKELEEGPEDESFNYKEREFAKNKNQIIVNPQNSIKYSYKKQIINEDNDAKMVGNPKHIEYAYDEEKSDSQIQQGKEMEQELDQDYNANNQVQGQYYVKEEIQQQQPDGQIKTLKYEYKGVNKPQVQTGDGSPITNQQEYYLRKNISEKVIQNDESEREGISQSQKQQGQQINLIYNKEGGSQKLSPNISGSPLTNENENSNQFKDAAFTPKESNRVRYITLKKRENEDEEESQPQDVMPQNAMLNQQTVNQETNVQSQQQIETQVNDQNEDLRQSENENEHEEGYEEEGYEEGYEEEHQGEEYGNENEEEEEHHHEEYQVDQGEIQGEYIQQQIEGEEEMQEHEEENEQVQEQDEVQNNDNNQQNINNNEEDVEHRVSAVEEITGQNINMQNIAQQQSNSLNDNQNILRTKISRTKGLREDNYNQMNIQSQQQELNQNAVRNVQNKENLAYSFGVSSGQNLSNSENMDILKNKNSQQSEISFGPKVMDSKMVINSSQLSNGKVISGSNATAEFGGEIIQNDAQYGRIEITANQKKIPSPKQEIKDSNKKEDEEDKKQ